MVVVESKLSDRLGFGQAEQYFWILRQNFSKSYYFENKEVRRSDMLNSYTQKNANSFADTAKATARFQLQ